MTEERVRYARAWVATIILAIATMICQADKTLPSLLMEPIKQSMALSDTQIGLLTGFAFAISMSLAALPIAWFADRHDRTLVLAIAIAVWCLLTVASGFARGFTTLFITRLGVGIGEAALLPVSLSLLGDLLPLDRIARAMAFMVYAGTAGGFVAMAGGGALYGGLHDAALAGHLPLAPEDAWRWTTIAFGAAGLIVAVMVATILPEPRRRASGQREPIPSSVGFQAYLRDQRLFLLLLVVLLAVSAIFVAGFNTWLTPLFVRNYGWSISQVGRVLGTVMLIGGLLAPMIGVFFNRLASRWRGRDAPLTAISVMLAVTLPFAVVGPLLNNGLWAALAIGVVFAITGGCSIVLSVVYVSIAPSHLRARVTATTALVAGVAGSTGSVIYAAVTDLVLKNPAKLYVTMSSVSGLLILISIGVCLAADRHYLAITTAARAAGIQQR